MTDAWPPELAAELVRLGLGAARSREAPMAVAVVDEAGRLVAFGRTLSATAAAVDCAPAKARTAVWFRRPTADTVEMARRRPEVYQSLIGASPQELVLSMGGIPLWGPHGELKGAVAAAGAALGATDIEVADEMASAWHEHVASGEG